MSTNFVDDDRKRISRIREAWERFDNTGDITAIADYLAEDIVLMPPGAPPVVGKDTVVQALTDGGDYNITQESEGLFISETLVVDRITVRGTADPTTDDASGDVSLKGVDVYRRDAGGAWKCIITIWNHQA